MTGGRRAHASPALMPSAIASASENVVGMFFGHAATQDMPASSEWTRKALRWEPTGPELIEDLTNMKY
jgi:hypothetical protein